jgi:hypothetical protein
MIQNTAIPYRNIFIIFLRLFGGSRKSGTNDKAGSISNLYRWVSMRSMKETFAAPLDWTYPYMGDEK